MGQNTNTLNSFEQVFTNYRATLDSITKQNIVLREKILEAKLEQSSENDRFLVFNSVIEAALQENQALQGELQLLNNKDTFKKKEQLENKGVTREQEKVKYLSLNPTVGKPPEVKPSEVKPSNTKNSNLEEGERCVQKENNKALEDCRKLQEDIEILRSQKGNLQEQFEYFKSKLPQEDAKERYAKLEAEKNLSSEENTQLREEISQLIRKLAEDSCWKKKSKELMITKCALERENVQLKKHLKILTILYDQNKMIDFEYKQKAIAIDELKTANDRLQHNINNMEVRWIHLEAKKMIYSTTDSKEEDIEAMNKKLVKEKKKLEKKLQRLEKSEVAIQDTTFEISELRRENNRLSTECAALLAHLERKGLIKAHLNTLKAEKISFENANKTLRNKITSLLGVSYIRPIDIYLSKTNMCKNQIKNLQDINSKLVSEYEELFVTVHSKEMLEISYENLNIELKEMKELNYMHRLDVRQQMEKVNNKAGPSSSG